MQYPFCCIIGYASIDNLLIMKKFAPFRALGNAITEKYD